MPSTSVPKTRSIAFLLAVACVLAFAQVFVNGFVAYDDDVYVYANPVVREGLTWAGVEWAFTTHHAANWHPLTWLSHMLDVELFGLNATGHHASALVLHVLATWALLAALVRAGVALGASAFVAAVFALHPTRVESVAWIAERKDVLCALFWFLGLGAWVRWSRGGGARWFVVTLLCHALALLAKPMAVTLPLTLLCLDRWPLARARGLVSGVVEKLPFFALSALSSVMTWRAQSAGGAVSGLDVIPLGERIANAFASFAAYLARFVWPFDLAVLYPLPRAGRSPAELVVGVAAFALAVALAVWTHRRRPAITVGVAWFALTLLPVIGLVQVGLQANADRYTYVPYVGVAFVIVGALETLRVDRAKLVHASCAALAGVWCVLTFVQTGTWRDTPTLFRRALAVTEDNFIAHNNLGMAFLDSGAVPEAIVELEACVRIRPDYHRGQSNLASAYVQVGRYTEAERVYRSWIATHGDEAMMLANLGTLELRVGAFADARRTLERAVALDAAGATQARARLVDLTALTGDFGAAETLLAGELAQRPDDPELAARLAAVRALAADPFVADPGAAALRAELAALEREIASALVSLARAGEAVAHLRRASELTPADADVQVELAVAAVGANDLALAEQAFARAAELAPQRADVFNNLGFVRYRVGELAAARDAFRRALELAPNYAEARKNLDAVERELAQR
ncbi:MAG: tetratricopeptide repeat protein [Planctomycetes bacterium]|nr:tetratricopeptide repeat protein [Planctomycetota bacterium]